ncbi:hypothetical protein COT72_00015 [archaeon CG10_big_fil_rev_8_21_14_0_10_43_11]|nr:MAG: hypothetical protein COT72_00015 [archaeon CG10_big_fil_rev_8_21_14_0_10_43_11]
MKGIAYATENLQETTAHCLSDLIEYDARTSPQHNYLKACAFISAQYDSRTRRAHALYKNGSTGEPNSIHHEYELRVKPKPHFKKGKNGKINTQPLGSCDLLVLYEGGVRADIIEAGSTNLFKKIKYVRLLKESGFQNVQLTAALITPPGVQKKKKKKKRNHIYAKNNPNLKERAWHLLESGFDRVIYFEDPLWRRKHNAENKEYNAIVKDFQQRESNGWKVTKSNYYKPFVEFWLEQRDGKDVMCFKALTIESLL